MTNNQLTDAQISNATLIRLIRWADEHKSHYVASALRELQERRNADSEPVHSKPDIADAIYEAFIVVCECHPDGVSILRNARKYTDKIRHAQPSPVVPDGYVMVPKEPTEEMLQASYREASVYSPTAYRAMIAAATQETDHVRK